MGFFHFWKRPKAENHEDDELNRLLKKEERGIKSVRIRFLQKQKAKLEEKYKEIELENEIAEMKEELALLDEEDEENNGIEPDDLANPDRLLSSLLLTALTKGQQLTPSGSSVGVPQTSPTSEPIPIEELKELRDSLGKDSLSRLKKLPDDKLRPLVAQYIPGATPIDVENCIKVIRE